MTKPPCILYCNCTYAQVVPEATKQAVLQALSASGARFEAVADLCEMSARKDPALARIAGQDGLKIAACYKRAVNWLFHAAGHKLPDGTEILNMREATPEAVVQRLFESVQPVSETAT